MRHKLFIAGLMAAVAMPSLAFAQPGCVRSNNQTTGTGAVLGALGGALIGNALGGRHSRGIDTAAGAVAGGVAGGALASGYNQPCPDGYYRQGPPPPEPGYGPGYAAPAQGSFWYGAPAGIHERIDFLYQRIGNARSAGYLGRHDADSAYHDLSNIRAQEGQMRYHDGGHLSPPDRGYLQSRLDNLSQRIHWQSHGG
jgi:hypothetical protein